MNIVEEFINKGDFRKSNIEDNNLIDANIKLMDKINALENENKTLKQIIEKAKEINKELIESIENNFINRE